MADVGTVASNFAQGLGLAAPVIGVLIALHRLRGDRLTKIEEKLEVFDVDIDGLTTQLQKSELAAERRFVTREDHTEAINRLDRGLESLAGVLGRIDAHLARWS